MRAAVIKGPNQMDIQDVPRPRPAKTEATIKVAACGICGTDVHILSGEFPVPYPCIPGHESVGFVDELGSDVKSVKVGDLVAIDPAVTCNRCYFCAQNQQNHCESWNSIGGTLPGAYAEYVAVPQANLFPVSFSDPGVGVLAEPLACVIYGHERARLAIGASVLIFGAGPIGLLHLQLSLLTGASTVDVVDLNTERLQLAGRLGARHCVPGRTESLVEALCDLEPRGYDLVIDATGSTRALQSAIRLVKNSGKLLIFGVCPENERIEISPYDIYRRDLTILGSFSIRRTFLAALRMIDGGHLRLEELLGGRYSLEDLPRALESVAKGQADKKLLVVP
jgi:2-desacetyl-2-hydroxyethyl bacteriochlorophyllide A dehydrogenase